MSIKGGPRDLTDAGVFDFLVVLDGCEQLPLERELRELYRHYGEGSIPVHLLELALKVGNAYRLKVGDTTMAPVLPFRSSACQNGASTVLARGSSARYPACRRR